MFDERVYAFSLSPERTAEWRADIGLDILPIKSTIPEWVNLSPLGSCFAYFVDLDALSPEQHDRLAHSLAQRFELSQAETAAELIIKGMPIVMSEDLVLVVTAGEPPNVTEMLKQRLAHQLRN